MAYTKNSLKYNYTYRITNHVNGKVYIGVHKSDTLNDGYMGSGLLIKRAIAKHGIENFTKEIIEFHGTYEDAMLHEAELVTLDFVNLDSNYNVREGGFGRLSYNAEARKATSERTKQWWDDNKEQEVARRHEIGSYEKIGDALRGKPKTKEHSDKINKNPEKIAKTAAKHRGMKRSDEAKQLMSSVRKAKFATGELEAWNKGKEGNAKGAFHAHNPITGHRVMLHDEKEIPDGYIKGRPRKT